MVTLGCELLNVRMLGASTKRDAKSLCIQFDILSRRTENDAKGLILIPIPGDVERVEYLKFHSGFIDECVELAIKKDEMFKANPSTLFVERTSNMKLFFADNVGETRNFFTLAGYGSHYWSFEEWFNSFYPSWNLVALVCDDIGFSSPCSIEINYHAFPFAMISKNKLRMDFDLNFYPTLFLTNFEFQSNRKPTEKYCEYTIISENDKGWLAENREQTAIPDHFIKYKFTVFQVFEKLGFHDTFCEGVTPLHAIHSKSHFGPDSFYRDSDSQIYVEAFSLTP